MGLTGSLAQKHLVRCAPEFLSQAQPPDTRVFWCGSGLVWLGVAFEQFGFRTCMTYVLHGDKLKRSGHAVRGRYARRGRAARARLTPKLIANTYARCA